MKMTILSTLGLAVALGVFGCAGGGSDESARPGGSPDVVTLPELVTSAPDAYWDTSGHLTPSTAETANVTVDDTSVAQTWEGFGGAFNEKGWVYLSMLSKRERDRAIELLFGQDGARFNLGRIPIGSSDYAIDRYTLDETTDDTSLTSFSIDRDRENLIPYVEAAMAVNPDLRFWASPWTPPTWMKQGPFKTGGVVSAFDGGTLKEDDATLAALARYLVRFVQDYAEQGIEIEVISPQNEPGMQTNYPSCGWTAATFVRFIGQYLGPALAEAGLQTKVMVGTLNGSAPDNDIITGVTSDAAAMAYVGVLGLQWGMQHKVSESRTLGLSIWQTEHQCGNNWWEPDFQTPAPNDHAYAVESWGFLRGWIKAGVNTYSSWNMVLDRIGNSIDSRQPWPQNALLAVDTVEKALVVTPTYHVFRHFSQFVAPGAAVLATSGGDAVAFKNPDGSIVTVMYNPGEATDYVLSVRGTKLAFAMPANGWATVNYTPEPG